LLISIAELLLACKPIFDCIKLPLITLVILFR
jgi:hypothetical protein